ncbi:armadillo-type protein [Syncephalis fuscata]|nr:armadillo-type protein [Syncephalis fuscata]
MADTDIDHNLPRPISFLFDEEKYNAAQSPEKRSLLTFRWLSALEKDLQTVPRDILKASQEELEKILLRLLSDGAPSPGRPVRILLRRCCVLLFERGNARSLVPWLLAAQNILGAPKDQKPTGCRIAAAGCIGSLLQTLGFQVFSHIADFITTSIKLVKSVSVDHELRVSVVLSVSRALQGAGKGCPDVLGRDLLKMLKTMLADEGTQLRLAALKCIEALVACTSFSKTLREQDMDALLDLVLKAISSGDVESSKTAASTIAALLLCRQVSQLTALQKAKAKDAEANGDAKEISAASVVLEAADLFSKLPRLIERYIDQSTALDALFMTYGSLCTRLGPVWTQGQLHQLLNHLFIHSIEPLRLSSLPRQQSLSILSVVDKVLLDTVAKRLMDEPGRIVFVRELLNAWLTGTPTEFGYEWPVSRWILVSALRLTRSLINILGGAVSAVQEEMLAVLMPLLQHPRATVYLATSACISAFADAVHGCLPVLMPTVYDLLQRALKQCKESVSIDDAQQQQLQHQRLQNCISYAYAVGALACAVSRYPLDASYETNAWIFSLASQLLKSVTSAAAAKENQQADPRVIYTNLEVGWTLLTALTYAGPDFVSLHLSQLLLLWKAALPRPSARDNDPSTGGGRSEAAWSYLLHGRALALTALLGLLRCNQSLLTPDITKRVAALLLNTWATLCSVPSAEARSASAADAVGVEENRKLLKLRLFECLSLLEPTTLVENAFKELTQTAAQVFLDPEYVAMDFERTSHQHQQQQQQQQQGLLFSSYAIYLDEYNVQPIDEMPPRPLSALEYDPAVLFRGSSFAPPLSFSLVTASVCTFGQIFVHLPEKEQARFIGTMIAAQSSPQLEHDIEKRMAVRYNVISSLLYCFIAARNTPSSGEASFFSDDIAFKLQKILQDVVSLPDPILRRLASNALGRLSYLVGNKFVVNQLQLNLNHAIQFRDPEVRAGCTFVIASICSRLGSIQASVHLETVVGIMHTLCNDPHPTVHTWALEALGLVVESSGVMFTPYISSTIGLMAKLFLSDSHTPAPRVVQQLGRILCSLLGTLGPELQANYKLREVIQSLVQELAMDTRSEVAVEGMRCLLRLQMFSPSDVDLRWLLIRLRQRLVSEDEAVLCAVVACLYQIIQTVPRSEYAEQLSGIEHQLFNLLDDDPQLEDTKNAISALVQHTTSDETAATWITLCSRMFVKDNEKDSTSRVGRAAYGWQACQFAINCVCNVVIQQRSLPVNEHQVPVKFLMDRLVELVKLAFLASTANVETVRIGGLKLLAELVKTFGDMDDPEFPGSSLLEQYQAQIVSALTPALDVQAPPQVMATAMQVCGLYVGSACGAMQGAQGRVLRLMVSMLSQLDEEDATVHANTSPPAKVMIRLAILTAWADILHAGQTVTELAQVVRPYTDSLLEWWLIAVGDYARLKIEESGTSNTRSNTQELRLATGLDAVYASSMRRIVYPYYKLAWPHISRSLGILLQQAQTPIDDDDDDDTALLNSLNPSMSQLLYGLCVWELTDEANEMSVIVSCIQMIEGILKRQLLHQAVLTDTLFYELVSALYRASRAFRSVSVDSELCRLLQWLICHGPSTVREPIIKILATMTQTTQQMTTVVQVSLVIDAFLVLAEQATSTSTITVILLFRFINDIFNNASMTSEQNFGQILAIVKKCLQRIEPLVIKTDTPSLKASAVFLQQRIHATTQTESETSLTLLTLSIASLPRLIENQTIQKDLQKAYETILGPGTEEKKLLQALRSLRTLCQLLSTERVSLLAMMTVQPIVLLIQRLRGSDCLTINQLDIMVEEALRACCTLLVSLPSINGLSVALVAAIPWLDYIDASVRHAVAKLLLTMAAEQAPAFRQALTNLPSEQASQLETALRQFAIEQQTAATNNQPTQSKIELKSAFSF